MAEAKGGAARGWLSTLPAVLLLVGVIVHGLGEKVHARFLQLGESMWTGYAELRVDPVAPTCDPAGAAATTDEPDEEAAGDDEGDDFLDDLLGDEDEDAEAAAAAAEAARARCVAEHERYKSILARTTGGVKFFRALETAIAWFVAFGVAYLRHALVLLLLICAATATALRHHIALRPVRSLVDDRFAEGGQLVANLFLLVSSFFKFRVDQNSGLVLQHEALPVLWMVGFAAMAGINIAHLLRPPADLIAAGNRAKAPLTIPLYAGMAIISGLYFFIVEFHPSGLAIYLQKLTEHALLYIHVGLYVWAGMLLKRTRLASLSFDVVRPWKLPAELLAFVVVAAAAIPTAYSGASGIFVIAAGAVIYDELKRAGARTQLALAATAMSGSLGVVLPPCLLVVIVASLNKQVTTDQLFGWGWKVFGLTTLLFLGASLLVRRGKLTMAPPKEALRGSLEGLRPMLPYILIGLAVLLGYGVGLSVTLNEHTAPTMLPIILLLLLWYDRRAARRKAPGDVPVDGVRASLFDATSETTGHIGALLMLMGLSVCIGGVIERGEVMALVPEAFSSPLMAMSVLVVFLVLIGMVMDPYGAVILVSAAIAGIAYRSGIDPVHFWMVVLVAFELGYLTPPVALNHLLTRQVVGVHPDQIEAETAGESFWRRHERILLPMTVMATALILVAFVPLFW